MFYVQGRIAETKRLAFRYEYESEEDALRVYTRRAAMPLYCEVEVGVLGVDGGLMPMFRREVV